MEHGRGKRRSPAIDGLVASACLIGAIIGASCGNRSGPAAPPSSPTTLQVGVAQLSANSPIAGFKQLSPLLTVENLARIGEDGRMQRWLADSWSTSEDGRLLQIKLRPGVKFSDGTAFDAMAAAKIFPDAARSSMGPLFDDIERVEPVGSDMIQIRFRRPSMFHLEALESSMVKPAGVGIGTGPYMTVSGAATEFRANPNYYLGRSQIERIAVSNYPSVRAAWAEALRGNVDFLYELGTDVLDSMERSTTISTFVFTRRYQHVLVLNSRAKALQSVEFRNAINAAIDRSAVVREALNGHGLASSGPIWPQYWARPRNHHEFSFDASAAAAAAQKAAKVTGGNLHFTCLVLPNAVDERIALEIKRQLASFGIDMAVEGVSNEEALRPNAKRDYEAMLLELVSGPTFLRPYLVWSSTSAFNYAGFGNPTIDKALENVRNAATEEKYREAIAAAERAFEDDPPAVFLAWSQRARAISKRFIVPPPEPGRDVLSTLRLWKPASGERNASRN